MASLRWFTTSSNVVWMVGYWPSNMDTPDPVTTLNWPLPNLWETSISSISLAKVNWSLHSTLDEVEPLNDVKLSLDLLYCKYNRHFTMTFEPSLQIRLHLQIHDISESLNSNTLYMLKTLELKTQFLKPKF